MKCIYCGNEIASGEEYCGECGHQEPKLPLIFEKTETRFNFLKHQLQNGEINKSEYETALKKLVFKDDHGIYWMLGANSGKWYSYSDKNWKEAEPPYLQPSKDKALSPNEIIKDQAILITKEIKESSQQKPPFSGILNKKFSPRSIKFIGIGLASVIILSALIYIYINLSSNWKIGFGSKVAQVPTAAPSAQSGFLETSSISRIVPITTPRSWIRMDIPLAGLLFYVPDNYRQEEMGDNAFILRDPNTSQKLRLQVNFLIKTDMNSQENILNSFLKEYPQYVFGSSQKQKMTIGTLYWKEGHQTNWNPIFYGIFGPLRDKTYIRFFGVCFEEQFEEGKEFFLQLINKIRYD
jgi:hypothetical protein